MVSLIDLLVGLLMWLAIFISSTIAGSAVCSAIYRKRRCSGEEGGYVLVTGIATQVFFVSLSIIVPPLLGFGNFVYALLRASSTHVLLVTLCTSVTLLIFSVSMNVVNTRIAKDFELSELAKATALSPVLSAFALLVLAPIDEELLFRGVLEWYLLISDEHMMIAALRRPRSSQRYTRYRFTEN